MIDALRHLDARTAAGVLAQTALKIDGNDPVLDPLIENQDQVEKSIIDQLRLELNLQPADWSENAIAKLSDALDTQTEALVGPAAGGSVGKLSAEGKLPSDVYQIEFSPHLAQNFGPRWDTEARLATTAIRGPHIEQVLGADPSAPGVPFVSLFARFYNHRFPARSFWMLVLAERQAIQLNVLQVWRVYSQEVDLSECESLMDVVRAFTEKYGATIEVDGKKSKFFFEASAEGAKSASRRISINQTPGRIQTITWFTSKDLGSAYLIVPVDLTDYFKSVEKWHGWDKDIFEELDARLFPIAGPAPVIPPTLG
jgi:hypothetical protein